MSKLKAISKAFNWLVDQSFDKKTRVAIRNKAAERAEIAENAARSTHAGKANIDELAKNAYGDKYSEWLGKGAKEQAPGVLDRGFRAIGMPVYKALHNKWKTLFGGSALAYTAHNGPINTAKEIGRAMGYAAEQGSAAIDPSEETTILKDAADATGTRTVTDLAGITTPEGQPNNPNSPAALTGNFVQKALGYAADSLGWKGGIISVITGLLGFKMLGGGSTLKWGAMALGGYMLYNAYKDGFFDQFANAAKTQVASLTNESTAEKNATISLADMAATHTGFNEQSFGEQQELASIETPEPEFDPNAPAPT